MTRPFASATRQWDDLYRTSAWQVARRIHLAHNPRCVDCGSTRNLQVDHDPRATTLAEFWDGTRWRTRCRACHAAKTGRETQKRYDRKRAPERHPGLVT